MLDDACDASEAIKGSSACETHSQTHSHTLLLLAIMLCMDSMPKVIAAAAAANETKPLQHTSRELSTTVSVIAVVCALLVQLQLRECMPYSYSC
jgi:hypothetical protein